MGMRRTKGGDNWRVSEPVRNLGACPLSIQGDQSLCKEKAASQSGRRLTLYQMPGTRPDLLCVDKTGVVVTPRGI